MLKTADAWHGYDIEIHTENSGVNIRISTTICFVTHCDLNAFYRSMTSQAMEVNLLLQGSRIDVGGPAEGMCWLQKEGNISVI